MKEIAELKLAVLQQLGRGQENAIKGKALAQRLGMKDTRTIREALLELNKDGIPVCSSPQEPYGYYIAATEEEALAALAVLRSYGKNIFRHYWHLKKAKETAFGMAQINAGQLSLRI